jgi:hypothetical protein
LTFFYLKIIRLKNIIFKRDLKEMIFEKVKLISVLTILSMTFLCCSALDTSIENDAINKEEEAEVANIYYERVMSKLMNSINSAPKDKLIVQILMSAILQRITQMVQEQKMVSNEHLRQDQY